MRPGLLPSGGRQLVLPLVAALLTAGCSMPKLPAIPEPAFSAAGEKQLQQLDAALQAESFQVGGSFSIINDSTTRYLTIDILNAEHLGDADTLQPHLKRLARTVVRSLTNAQEFQVVQVNVQETHNYVVASTNRSQTAEYTMQELQ